MFQFSKIFYLKELEKITCHKIKNHKVTNIHVIKKHSCSMK